MSHINDCMHRALRFNGFSGSLNDALLAFYKAEGATSGHIDDAEMEFLRLNGASNWYDFFVSQGLSGSVDDMAKQWWCDKAALPQKNLLSWYVSNDIQGAPNDKVASWPAIVGSDLAQSDPLLQPIKGPNGGLLPEGPTTGQHLMGGDWCDPLAANQMTTLVCFILHDLTNGALLGSEPSDPANRASISHWSDGDTYMDWGDIVSGGPGRISFTYQPPLLQVTTTGMRKEGPQFDAFIDGALRMGSSNNTNYTGDGTTGGRLLTHIVALGQTDSAMLEILEIAVWTRPLSDDEIQEVHNVWMNKYSGLRILSPCNRKVPL